MKWYYGLYPTDRIKIKNTYYYISDFFPNISILFSIWPIIHNCKYFYEKIKKKPFRQVFSIPNNTKIILDSGSFGYYRSKNKIDLELGLNKILKIYDLINPNYAVHNDIPLSFLKTQEDYNLKKLKAKNIDNAKEFLIKVRDCNYEPIGVAQGITESDYSNQVLELYQMGYNYIGIGGIAYLGIKRLNTILTSIFRTIKKEKLKIKVHIFGVGKLSLLKNYPIHSFDNTTPLNDSHRDKLGKRTYYYILDKEKKVFEKKSLIFLQKQNYKVNCDCPLCRILSNEILLTGSALRNHSRAFHNAFIYKIYLSIIN